MNPVIIWVGIGLLAVIVFGWVIALFNSLVRLKNNIEKAWSNIDVLLKQRQDELTKLMDTIKGYMQYERTVLENITKARSAYKDAKTVGEKADADNMLTETLKTLFAVSENYPDLKANQNFMAFQKRISEIETMIADRREFYNDSVNIFNIRIQSFPAVMIARMLGYTERELFKATAEEKKDVEVNI